MKHHRGVWEMQPDQTEIESKYHKIASWSTKLVEVSSHIWVTWHFCDLELSSRGEGECCGAQWLAEQKCWWVAWMVAWRYSATSAAGIFCVLLVLLNKDWRDLNWLFFRDCVQIKSDFFVPHNSSGFVDFIYLTILQVLSISSTIHYSKHDHFGQLQSSRFFGRLEVQFESVETA